MAQAIEPHGQDAPCHTSFSYCASERPRMLGREGRGLRPSDSRGQADTQEQEMGHSISHSGLSAAS
eukprot:5183367-Pyramimonas_sp.AAC.1